MNRMNVVVGFGAALCVTGCGITLEANRVRPGEAGIKAGLLAPTQVQGEGIVYALPRTEFEVVQPIKLAFSTAGGLRGIYDTCRRACDALPAEKTSDACDFDTTPRLTFAPPDLRTLSLPDYARLYQVAPSADLFQTLNFKFEIASNGVVEQIDASASNTGFELVSNFASNLLKAATWSTQATYEAKSRSAGTTRRTCYQTSQDTDSLLKAESGNLACKLVKEVEVCMTSYEADIKAEQRALDAVFDRALDGSLKADLVVEIAANRRERLAAATRRRDEAAALFGLGGGQDVEAVYQAILPMGGPQEFQAFDSEVNLGLAATTGIARIVGMSDNAGSLMPRLMSHLALNKRHYAVRTLMPPGFETAQGEEAATLGKGYRYRVPVQARAVLTVFQDEKKLVRTYGPANALKAIAQYGPIAALQGSFKGKGGRVLVKHWPDSGGIQTVEIGAEALPTAAVADVLDTVAGQLKDRRDKKAAAAAANAAADPELDALTRQQKLLELQKQIKDLQAELAAKPEK